LSVMFNMILRLTAAFLLSASVLVESIPLAGFPPIMFSPAPLDESGNFVAASYDGYDITLADGVTLSISLSGDRVVFYSDAERSYDIVLSKCKTQRVVRNFNRAGDAFEIQLSGFMNEGELYYLTIKYEALGRSISNGNNIIFMSGGSLYFWKSANYENNVETCAELLTDSQSLKECLEPQNDVESDDPYIIAFSNKLCEGAEDDWEKVYRIYDYVSHELEYDAVESDDDSKAYQDGAIEVIRDGKGICEGFANVFVALCRAQGIPAVIEFGIGFSNYDYMMNKDPDDVPYADHAWAAVFLGGKWHFVDPTYDMTKYYYGPDNVTATDDKTLYYLLPLESFSNDHMIQDADTRHSIPSSGSCGKNATYTITRDGVCCISGSGNIRMPDGVIGFNKLVFADDCTITTIGKNCFYDCDLITTVILPDTVTSIEENAFGSCEDLEYVYIPNGCRYIGRQAFDYCDELSYVYIPDSVKMIASWAFDDCPRLYICVSSRQARFADSYGVRPMYIEVR